MLTNQSIESTDPFGHSLNPSFSIALSVFLIIIAFCGIFFNLALIVVILSKRSLCTTTNCLIINLAVGDFITAVFTVPLDVDYLLRGYYPFGVVPCAFKETAFMLSLPSSVVNLSLLTIERFFSVKYPFLKIRHFSKRNMLIVVALGWTYSFMVALFPIMYDPYSVVVESGHCFLVIPLSYQVYQLFINFLLPLILILALNGSLFSVAAGHADKIRRQSIFPSSSVIKTKKKKKSRTSSIVPVSLTVNLKAAKTVLMLVGAFTISWVVFIFLAVWNVLCNICHPREVTWSANAINYCNIAVNPVVYGLLNKNLRETIFMRLKSLKYRANISSIYHEETSFIRDESNLFKKDSTAASKLTNRK